MYHLQYNFIHSRCAIWCFDNHILCETITIIKSDNIKSNWLPSVCVCGRGVYGERTLATYSLHEFQHSNINIFTMLYADLHKVRGFWAHLGCQFSTSYSYILFVVRGRGLLRLWQCDFFPLILTTGIMTHSILKFMTYVLFLLSTILRLHQAQIEQRITNIFTENKLNNKIIISLQDATWPGDFAKYFIDR